MERKNLKNLFVVVGIILFILETTSLEAAECDEKCLSSCSIGCVGIGGPDPECLKMCTHTCCPTTIKKLIKSTALNATKCDKDCLAQCARLCDHYGVPEYKCIKACTNPCCNTKK